jgi:hypothetical protein
MAYAEGLLSALAAGCLLALLDRRWVLAGLLALVAGLARPSGGVLVLACLVAAIVAIRQRDEWRSLAAVALAPWGMGVSWAVIGARVGRYDAWFVTERDGWHAHFDAGLYTARAVWRGLTGQSTKSFAVPAGLFVIVALVLVVIAARQHPPAPVLAYLIGGFMLAVGTSGVQASIPRFLLPVFPLLVPVAQLLDRLGRYVASGLLVAAAGLSIGLGAWYAAVSTFSP